METITNQPAEPPEPELEQEDVGGFVRLLWLRADEFCADESAVKAWREFLGTSAGIKLRRVVLGLNPLARLATLDTLDPKIIRAAAAAESHAEGSLLGKATGYQAIDNLLFQRLVKFSQKKPKPSSRRGSRDITPHPSSLPS